MKTAQLISGIALFIIINRAGAQVETDHAITFTGAGADAKVSGIKDVSSPEDAVNVTTLQQNKLVFASDMGSADHYIIDLDPAVTSYVPGMIIYFFATNSNTGPSVINVNGLGEKQIKISGTLDLEALEISAGQAVSLIYDGTSFQLMSQRLSSGSGAISYTTGESANGGIVIATWDNGTHGWVSAPADESPSNQTWWNGGNLCESKTTGGYMDWVVPNKSVLNLLFAQQGTIGGFNSSFRYWSSTHSALDNRAWEKDFGSGFLQSSPWDYGLLIRCVREF